MSDIFCDAVDLFIQSDIEDHNVIEDDEIELDQTIGFHTYRENIRLIKRDNSHCFLTTTKDGERGTSLMFFNQRNKFLSEKEELTIVHLCKYGGNSPILKKNNILSSIFITVLKLLEHDIVLSDLLLKKYFKEISRNSFNKSKLVSYCQNIRSFLPNELLLISDDKLENLYKTNVIPQIVKGYVWNMRNDIMLTHIHDMTDNDLFFIQESSSWLYRLYLELVLVITKLNMAVRQKEEEYCARTIKEGIVSKLFWRLMQMILEFYAKTRDIKIIYGDDILVHFVDILHTPKWDCFWMVENTTDEYIDTCHFSVSLQHELRHVYHQWTKTPNSQNITLVYHILNKIKREKFFERIKTLDSNVFNTKRSMQVLMDLVDPLLKMQKILGPRLLDILQEKETVLKPAIQKINIELFEKNRPAIPSTYFGFKKYIFNTMNTGYVY